MFPIITKVALDKLTAGIAAGGRSTAVSVVVYWWA